MRVITVCTSISGVRRTDVREQDCHPRRGTGVKAAVYKKYGPPEVLQVKEIEKPIPKDNQILVRVFPTTVTSGDVRVIKANPYTVRLYFGMLRTIHPVLV